MLAINNLKLVHNNAGICSSILKYNRFILRSSNKILSTKFVHDDNDKWFQIYKFSQIRTAAAFNKLKIYQGSITAMGTPLFFSLESAGHLPHDFGITFATLGVTGFVTLLIGSWFFKNLIGIIYLHEKEDKIKISYIDFWGRRQNAECSIDELIPLSEIPRMPFDIYQPVVIETRKEKYKLLHRFGEIVDVDKYFRLFG